MAPVANNLNNLNGLRLGTPEIVRRGLQPADMPELAKLIARALQATDPAAIAAATTHFRHRFQGFSYVC